MTTSLSIISSIKLKLFILVLTFIALGADSVNAACSGQYKCRPFDSESLTCENSGWNGHACQGSTSNTCDNYIFNCDGGCDAQDDCAWSTSGGSSPTNTPAPGQQPTTPPSGSDRWKIRGRVEYYDNNNLSGASVVVTYSDNSTSTASTDSSGIFSFDRQRSAVPEGNYTVTTSKSGYRTLKAKGTIGNPGNCTKVSNDTGWRCSKDRGNTNGTAEILHNFEEEPPTTVNPPECTNISIPSSINKTSSNSFTISARDIDDGTANGAGIGFLQAFWRFTDSNTWNQIGGNDSSAPYSFTLGANAVSFSGTSKNIEVIANVYKTANCEPKNKSCTTGNSQANTATWTTSSACKKTVTVNANSMPYGGFFTAPGAETTNVANGGSVTFQGRCRDDDADLGKARIMRTEKPLSGGSWPGAWITGNSEVASTGKSLIESGSVTLTCSGNQAQKSHRMMVECDDTRGGKCSGNPVSGLADCGPNDFKVINCQPPATASPTPVAGPCSAPSINNPSNNCSGSTKSVTVSFGSISGCTQYEVQKATSGNFSSDLVSQTTTTTSTTFTGLTKSISHYFRVRCSAKSNSASCNVPGSWSATKTSSTCPSSPTATPVPGSCGGSIPSGAERHDAEEESQPIPAGTNWSYRPTDNATKCQYKCSANYEWDGNSCEPTVSLRTCGQSCNTTSSPCDTSLGLTCRNGVCRNASCSNSQQNASCVCQGAPTNTPTPNSCGGSIPSGAQAHDAEESTQPIPAGTNWSYRASDNGNKCQYKCSANYEWDGNSCEPTVSLRTCGQSCNTTSSPCDTSLGLTCRNGVCRNASCSNSQQNASCVCQGAPTPTPAPPSSCNSPSGFSCGGSCVTSNEMQVNCTWTRDTRVSGFRFTYDDDSGFGSDATNINLTTSGISPNATYTMSSNLPNSQHWFRVSNRTSDGSCNAALSQTSNTSTSGPAVCTSYVCTSTRPANSTIHAGDQPPTGGNLAWRHSTVDNSRQCEFYCDSGYTYNSTTNSCDSNTYSCGGTRPANTLYYSGDNQPNTSGVNWKYASSNTSAKCEFVCDTGYQWNASAGVCELPNNACIAPGNTNGSITCANGGTLNASWNAVSGATSYRYQRNTSPSTTGALTAVINGTSFTVPVDEPNVTNYFRVRVQTVGNSASCTAVGEWSAWKSVAANTSCVEPTDVPSACNRPDAVTVTEACSPVPQIGASWRKVAGVLRYEYQVRRVGDTWANKVDDGVVTQPSSAADPVMPAYLTEANPPEYNVRVRSICDNGSGGETATLWRTGVSNFVPPACGGPTPTPLPPPTYDVTVNLRVTDDNNCNTADPLLTNSDGRVRVDPPDPDPIYNVNVPNSGSLTLSGLSGINVIRPVWPEFGDDDTPAYSRAQLAGCSNPFSQTVTDASDGPLNFYFTEVSGPWWQSSFGDVYGDRLLSKIPGSANNKNLSISNTDPNNESDAGVVAWNVAANLSGGTPSQKGYQIDRRLPFLEDFDYFDNKLANEAKIVPSNNIQQIKVGIDGVYKLTGPQTVNSSWSSVSGKVVVVIDGLGAALRVEGPGVPLGMDTGGFVFFIVDGPITFAPEVNEVYGMFLATNDITIEYDNSNQQAFKGHGSFVSTNGDIVSYRSLEGSKNSTDPATEFIYDPSLVVNTPNVLRTNATVWEEVAP